MDLAQLAIRADSSDLVRARRDLDALPQSSKRAESATSSLEKSYSSLSVVATRLIGVLGAAGLGKVLLDSVAAATKYQNALNGLASVARYAGEDVGASMTKSLQLTKDGLLSTTEAVTALKNLLSRGFSTDEAVEMINRFKDSAAFGRQASLDFGAAVVSATEGIKNENSILVDNAGVTKNVSIMWKEYALQIDKSVTELTQAEKRTAEYNGILKETEGQLGNAALAANGADGSNARLKKTLTDIAVTIGTSLTPAYVSLTNAITKGFQWASDNAIKPFLFYFENIGIRIGETTQKAKVFFDVMSNPSTWGSGKLTEQFKMLEGISEEMRQAAFDRLNGAISPVMGADSGKRRTDSASANDAKATTKAVTETVDKVKEYQKQLSEQIVDLKEVNNLLQQGVDLEKARLIVNETRKGATPAQIEALQEQLDIQSNIEEAEQARQDRLQVWINTQQKAYDDELKAIESTKKANEAAAAEYLKTVKKAEEDKRREYERTAENLNRSLTDALLRGFESGKGFARNFRDTLINMFKTLVLTPVVNFILKPITDGLAGILTGSNGIGSMLTGSSSGGGFGGVLSDLGSIFTKSNQSIIGGIESLGASIANGMGGIRDTIGGFLGSNASLVANVASYGGAVLQLAQGNWAGAAGTAIGTALGGPVGGAIGSFLGGAIGGLFGGKDIPMTGDQAVTSFNAGKLSSKTNTFGKSSLGGKDALTQANEAFAKTYGALITQFDANAKFTIDTIYRSRTNTQGFFRFNGQGLQSGSQKGISFEGFIKKFMGEGLADVIRRSTAIPKAFRDLFIGLKKPEAVEQVVLNVIKLNENSAQLQSTLGITAEQVALLATESGIAGDNLTLLVNTVTGVSSQLFTIGDALVKVKAGIDGAFTSLSDSQLPANLKAFDEAIKALDKTTAQGRQDFLGLIQLREQFAQFEAAIGGLKSGVKGALFGIVSDAERQQMLNADLASMFAELNMTVPGSIQELIALGKSIDYTTAEGLNLASVFPNLVNAFNTTRGAVDSLINSLTSSRFETFADFAIGSSLSRQGVGLNQIPVRGASQGTDNQVAVLLTRLIAEVSEMKASTQQTADNTLRTTRELEDIAGGNVTLSTQAA